MSAEVLREGAALMRERAETAAEEVPDQRWVAGPAYDPDNNGWVVASDISEADGWDTTLAACGYDYDGDLSRHIASWHPAVALAVADWLDSTSSFVEMYGEQGADSRGYSYLRALAVARAYLGSDS